MSAAKRKRMCIIPQNLITASSRTAYTKYDRESFTARQKQAIKAAKELYYSKEVIRALEDATTDGEIERIMRDARRSQR